MNKYPTVIDFDNASDLCKEVIDNVENEDKYTVCTIVTDSSLAIELINTILAIKDLFHVVSNNKIDHLGFYYITITSDYEIIYEPINYKNTVLTNEVDMTYIQSNVPESLMKYFYSDFKVIFGIKE